MVRAWGGVRVMVAALARPDVCCTNAGVDAAEEAGAVIPATAVSTATPTTTPVVVR